MRIRFECTYCAHRWVDYFYSLEQAKAVKCIRCGDRKPKVRKDASGDVFGYEKTKDKDAYLTPKKGEDDGDVL